MLVNSTATGTGRFMSVVVAMAAFLLVGAANGFAQAATGSIAGVVTDSTQAPIAGATVTVRAGDVARTARTDSAGAYRFEGLAPATYEVTASWPGFTTVSRSVTVAAGEQRIALRLEPAPIAESVEVAFTAPRNSTALKYDVRAADVPLAVTGYTDSFMRAINARRTDSLFPYITGVTRSGDTAYDFTIRGVRAREPNNILVDGLPGLPVRFGSPTVAGVERIEVLRGPASVEYGQIQPGGLINIISKRPTAERTGSIELRAGSITGQGSRAGSARLDADMTGRIDSGARLMYRLSLSYDGADSFRTAIDERNLFISPALTWAPNARTALDVSIEYRRERTAYDDGLVAPNNDITRVAASNTWYQESDNVVREDGVAANLRFRRAIGSRFNWTTNWRLVRHHDDRHGYENFQINRDLVTLMRRDREQHTERRYHYVDSNLQSTVRTWGVQHTLLTGMTVGQELRAPNQITLTSSNTLNINIAHPVHTNPARPAPVAGQFRESEFLNTSVYLQDHVTFSPAWKALAGVRGDWQRGEYTDRRSAAHRTTSPSAVSPMAGLVFSPGTVWSAYANVATSFAPPNPEFQDASGQHFFEPERGRQVEAGTRAVFLQGRADASAALFEIRRTNVLAQAGGGVTIQTGAERSRGSEAELRLRIGGLQTLAGYAYTNARVTADSVAINVGSQVANVPAHSGNVWGRYDLRQGALRGLGLGLGLIYRGDRAGSTPLAAAPALLLPAYTRADASIYYVRGRLDMMLQVINLTDRRYFDSAQSAISIQPGVPRQLVVSLRRQF